MLKEIRPTDFWTHLQGVLPHLDQQTRDALRAISAQSSDGSVHPGHDLTRSLHALLEQATFRPALPLQVTVQSTTPASRGILQLGPCASAADALQTAAEHYSLAEAAGAGDEDDLVRMNYLSGRILLWLDLGGVPHFGARLPPDYKPALKPATVAIVPGGFGP